MRVPELEKRVDSRQEMFHFTLQTMNILLPSPRQIAYREGQVLCYIMDKGTNVNHFRGAARKMLMDALRMSTHSVSIHLKTLLEKGWIVQDEDSGLFHLDKMLVYIAEQSKDQEVLLQIKFKIAESERRYSYQGL